MGQKSKLLILGEYVNKTEKIEGTWANTNSYRENEVILSDIFILAFFNFHLFIKILSSLLILPIVCFDYTTRPLRKHDVIIVCSIYYLTTEIELMLATFKSWAVKRILEHLTPWLLSSLWNIYHSTLTFLANAVHYLERCCPVWSPPVHRQTCLCSAAARISDQPLHCLEEYHKHSQPIR